MLHAGTHVECCSLWFQVHKHLGFSRLNNPVSGGGDTAAKGRHMLWAKPAVLLGGPLHFILALGNTMAQGPRVS